MKKAYNIKVKAEANLQVGDTVYVIINEGDKLTIKTGMTQQKF
jgi:hypothetical protein